MLNKCRLKLLKQVNLHFRMNLFILIKLIGTHWLGLGIRGHSETTYAHGSPLKNRIDKTFNSVLKHNISNIADL